MMEPQQQQQMDTILQTICKDENSLTVLYILIASEGVHLLFSGQAEKAEKVFNSLRHFSGLHALGYGTTRFMRGIMTCDPVDIEEAITELHYAEKHASQRSPFTLTMLDTIDKEVNDIILKSMNQVYAIYGIASGSDVMVNEEVEQVEVFEKVQSDGKIGGPVHANYQRHHRRNSSASSMASLFKVNVVIDTTPSTLNTKPGFFARMMRGHRRRLSSSSVTLSLADLTSLERDLIIADALTMIGLLQFAQENIMSYIKGSMSLRKSFKLFENARDTCISHSSRMSSLNTRDALGRRWEEIKSSAHHGYGFLNVVFSALPPKVLRVIENFGVKGDRELGLKECFSTIDMGGARTPFAELSVLAYYYILSPILGLSPAQSVGTDPAKAEARAMLDLCMNKYSNGPMFLWIYGRACKDEGALSKATQSIEAAAELSHEKKMFQMEQLCYYDLGWCLLMEFRFIDAIKAFKKAASSSSNWSPGFYSYLIGCCYLASNEKDSQMEALNAFKDVPKKVKKTWTGRVSIVDKIALRKSKLLVETKESSFGFGMLYIIELMYLWNCLYAGVPKLANMLEELEKLESNQELRKPGDKSMLSCLLKGVIHRDLGHYDKAVAYFDHVEKQKEQLCDEKYIVPHAAFDLGVLYMHQNNPEKARESFLKARDEYSGYEFEDRLHFRLHTLLMKAESCLS